MEDATKLLSSYLSMGLNPIPLKGKVANYPWKSYKLTKGGTKYNIARGSNWGIRAGLLPSGLYLYFLDVDDKKNFHSLYKNMPPGVPIVSTGRGFHFYLTWTTLVTTRHLPGLDIIGNGYVVCPPSVHENGKEYRFIVPLGSVLPVVDPDSLTLFPFASNPVALPARLVHPDTRAVPNLDCDFNGVHRGQRHNALVRHLGVLFARYHLEEEALAIVIEWNSRCVPPLGNEEVRSTVRSCWQAWDKYEG